VTSIKLQLLELVAALDRGSLASHADKERVERLVRSLEESGAGLEPFGGTPAAVEGRWELLYTNKEVFRARCGLQEGQQQQCSIGSRRGAARGSTIVREGKVRSSSSNSVSW
jgi:hypothetical protein